MFFLCFPCGLFLHFSCLFFSARQSHQVLNKSKNKHAGVDDGNAAGGATHPKETPPNPNNIELTKPDSTTKSTPRQQFKNNDQLHLEGHNDGSMITADMASELGCCFPYAPRLARRAPCNGPSLKRVPKRGAPGAARNVPNSNRAPKCAANVSKLNRVPKCAALGAAHPDPSAPSLAQRTPIQAQSTKGGTYMGISHGCSHPCPTLDNVRLLPTGGFLLCLTMFDVFVRLGYVWRSLVQGGFLRPRKNSRHTNSARRIETVGLRPRISHRPQKRQRFN